MKPRIAFGCLFIYGCDSSEYGFAENIKPIIEQECVYCHNPNLAEGELDLVTDPYSTLLENESSQSDYPLITPENHLESYLWHKLNGTQSLAGGSGTRMPLDKGMNSELADEVQVWIDLGALP